MEFQSLGGIPLKSRGIPLFFQLTFPMYSVNATVGGDWFGKVNWKSTKDRISHRRRHFRLEKLCALFPCAVHVSLLEFSVSHFIFWLRFSPQHVRSHGRCLWSLIKTTGRWGSCCSPSRRNRMCLERPLFKTGRRSARLALRCAIGDDTLHKKTVIIDHRCVLDSLTPLLVTREEDWSVACVSGRWFKVNCPS